MPINRIRDLLFGRRREPPRRNIINMEMVVLIGIVAIIVIFLIKRGRI